MRIGEAVRTLTSLIVGLQDLRSSLEIAVRENPVCTADDCNSSASARGLCALHYSQWRREQLKINGVTGLRQIIQPAKVDPRQAQLFGPIHGENCEKALHVSLTGGYLHSEMDDDPYDVDGVSYCGRCHVCLPTKEETNVS